MKEVSRLFQETQAVRDYVLLAVFSNIPDLWSEKYITFRVEFFRHVFTKGSIPEVISVVF